MLEMPGSREHAQLARIAGRLRGAGVGLRDVDRDPLVVLAVQHELGDS